MGIYVRSMYYYWAESDSYIHIFHILGLLPYHGLAELTILNLTGRSSVPKAPNYNQQPHTSKLKKGEWYLVDLCAFSSKQTFPTHLLYI